MRLLGRTFLDAFPNAILNVHPSLLPAFPGVDAQNRRWTHGVKIAGATVHSRHRRARRRTRSSRRLPCRSSDDDTAESLAARILIEEHRIYPEAVSRVLDGGWAIEGRRFVRQRSPYV